MFHVERLDGFAAYLPRVMGFCIADQSVHHLIGTEAILDSPLNSSTWNPKPTSSGWTLVQVPLVYRTHVQSNL
jgi:hypothetical protein